MHELASVLADDVHADDDPAPLPEDELEDARGREDAAAQALVVLRQSLFGVDPFLPRIIITVSNFLSNFWLFFRQTLRGLFSGVSKPILASK